MFLNTKENFPLGQTQGLSASSSPTTDNPRVVAVEDEEGTFDKPHFDWQMERGLDRNFKDLGKLLASLGLELYQHAEGGLLLIEVNQPRRIVSARELAPLLIDHIRISVSKNGKYYGEKPNDSTLNNMLLSRHFLEHFRRIEEVVTTPIVLADYTPSRPGFNPGGILYLGPAVSPGKGIETITKFLDAFQFKDNADRTNTVAAALTVLFRPFYPGAKPLILVMSSISHGGKGTIIEFARGNTPKAQINYQDKDWPMQADLYSQFRQLPGIGVIDLDNVRTDSSGRGKIIRSAFLESFVTNSEIVLGTVRSSSKPIRTSNRYVVLVNTNEGALSIDLLNRSMTIRLNPTGDIEERIARSKPNYGSSLKDEWLPAHRKQIEAELWGMIERWVKAGKPLDEAVCHPMTSWAQTIGGILLANGFRDFLGNYSATKMVADAVKEALGTLAYHTAGKPMRAHDLAEMTKSLGLAEILLPGAKLKNEKANERSMGITLKPYVNTSSPL
jgi:hypothetical protein